MYQNLKRNETQENTMIKSFEYSMEFTASQNIAIHIIASIATQFHTLVPAWWLWVFELEKIDESSWVNIE